MDGIDLGAVGEGSCGLTKWVHQRLSDLGHYLIDAYAKRRFKSLRKVACSQREYGRYLFTSVNQSVDDDGLSIHWQPSDSLRHASSIELEFHDCETDDPKFGKLCAAKLLTKIAAQS